MPNYGCVCVFSVSDRLGVNRTHDVPIPVNSWLCGNAWIVRSGIFATTDEIS